MLDKQSGFHSSDKEVVRAALAHLGATRFDVRDGNKKYAYRIRVARQDNLTLFSSSCTSATEVTYEPASFVRQYFSFASTSVRFNMAGKTQELSKKFSSVIVPADRPLHAESATDHNLMVLRIETSALKNKLQSMLGVHIPGNIEFSSSPVSEAHAQHSMRQTLLQFAADLDFWGPQMLPSVRAEFEQALIVRFLLCNRHNFSSKLHMQPAAPSPSQLRRVVDYIEANWDKPLDIETLATSFDVSSRSLFRHFKKFRDCSPQDFIKSVRMKNVRTMLEAGDEGVSVMAVALKCGFHSFGHFARDYRDTFGELPSDTVRRARSSFTH